MAFLSADVANQILDLISHAGESVSPMKLQKLIFYSHGWHLALEGTPLIDEQVEAWRYGPVITTVYHELKHFGNDVIVGRLVGFNRQQRERWGLAELGGTTDEARRARHVIAEVLRVYGPLSAVRLSNMTHAKGTPWSDVEKEYHGRIPMHTDIPRSSIKAYFSKLAESRS